MIQTILSMALVLLSGFYGALAPIYLKKGLGEIEISSLRTYKNIIIAGFIFGTGLVPLILAMRYADLSLLYPLTALSYVWTALYSAYFLRESINKYTWMGIWFTVGGVILIGVSAFL